MKEVKENLKSARYRNSYKFISEATQFKLKNVKNELIDNEFARVIRNMFSLTYSLN